jgi:hypothetical protein
MTYRKQHKQGPRRQVAAEVRREEFLDQLADGIDALTSSAEWQRYLDVQSRFHHYSFSNTMLILLQYPDASRVASFRKWQELGRQVRKGETAVRVWAPHTYKVETEGEDSEAAVHRKLGFHLVPVFDVVQTEGDPLPEPVRLLQGEDEAGLFGRLSGVAEGLGYVVQVTPEIDGHAGANGLCEFGLRRITVAGDRSEVQKVKSLAHEIGHALLHEPPADGDGITRGLGELEAESVAYVVSRSLGLDTGEYSFGYVAGWSGGDPKAARQAIKASGDRIQGAARRIIDALDAAGTQAEPAAALCATSTTTSWTGF